MAAVCLTALTLITAASLPVGTGGHSGARTSLTRQSLLPTQNTRPSEEVLALQTDAWLRLGGRELLVKMTGEVLHIMTALQDDRAFTDRGHASRGRTRTHLGCGCRRIRYAKSPGTLTAGGFLRR